MKQLLLTGSEGRATGSQLDLVESLTNEALFPAEAATTVGLSGTGTLSTASTPAMSARGYLENRDTNPSQEAAGFLVSTNVAINTVAYDTSQSHSGTRSASSTRLAATPTAAIGAYYVTSTAALPSTYSTPIAEGEVMSYGMWVRGAQACQARINVNYRTGASTSVGSLTGAYTTLAANTWTLITYENVTSIATADRVCVRGEFITVSGVTSGGEQTWIDDVVVVSGTTCPDYFDGSTATDATYTYAWTGTANQSISSRTTLAGAPLSGTGTLSTASTPKFSDTGGLSGSGTLSSASTPVFLARTGSDVENMLPNPSHETNSGSNSNATTYNFRTQDTAQAHSGTYSFKWFHTADMTTNPSYIVNCFHAGGLGTTRIPVSAGQVYTGSMWVYVNASGFRALPRLHCYDASLALISTLIPGAYTPIAAPNTWQRISYTFAATPALTTGVYLGLYVNRTDGADVNYLTDFCWVDDAMLTAGSTLYDYFDGSTTDDNTYSYVWEGTANASASLAISYSSLLSGTGTLSAGGTPAVAGIAGLSGTGTLAAAPTPATSTTVGLSGEGTLTAVPTPSTAADVALSGTGTLFAAPAVAVAATPALSGIGTLTATPAAIATAADVALSGTGTLSTVVTVAVATPAVLSGTGTLSTVVTVAVSTTTALNGTGTLSVVTTPAFAASPALSGTGTLTVTEFFATTVPAYLNGEGVLTAVGVAVMGPQVTIWNGSAEVAATVTIWDGTTEQPATLELAP